MNVLITSASRKVNLVKAFKHALSEGKEGKVIAVDANPLASALYFADEYYIVPKSHSEEFLDIILKLCKTLSVKLLIPTRDEELSLFAINNKKFEEIGTKVMVSDIETIEICQDKELFVEFCEKNNFNVPKNYKLDENFKPIFPIFIKPKHGKGGKNTFCVRSEEELKLTLKIVPEPIIQEYIDSPEYTVDLFADFSGKVLSAIPRERIHVFGGESIVTRTFKNFKLINESIKLAESLNLIGHNTIQCFFEEDEVKFIEVNPRFGGAASLSFAAGVHTPTLLVDLIKGKKLKPLIGDFKDNYVMLRYIEDTFFDYNQIKPNKFQ